MPTEKKTYTGNTGILKTYPCCECCAASNCDRFVDEVVTCSICGFSCSCEGCVAEEDSSGA